MTKWWILRYDPASHSADLLMTVDAKDDKDALVKAYNENDELPTGMLVVRPAGDKSVKLREKK